MANLRSPSTPILTALLLGMLFSFAGQLGAQEKPARDRARMHFDQALRHVDQDRHEAAVAEFWRAYQAHPNYRVLYNIGQADVLLGKHADALRAFQRYLDEAGDQLPESRRSQVEVEMRQLRARVGELVVTVEPAAASVQLDGKTIATPSAQNPLTIDAGGHALRISLDGYMPVVRTFSVAPGERFNTDIHLTPSQPTERRCTVYGQLRITCSVPEAGVLIDGRRVGTTPLPDAVLLPAGGHTLDFARPGYVFESGPVVIRDGRVESATCRYRTASGALGQASAVHFAHVDPGASILDNGRPFANTARVPAGLHDFVVQRSGYLPWRRSIRLTPGETRRVEVRLSPSTREALDQVQSAHEQRLWAYGTASAGLAMGVGAVAHGLWNHGRFERWSEEQDRLSAAWSSPSPGAAAASSRQTDNDALLHSIHTADRVTVALAVGAGALMTAGVVLYLTGDDPYLFDGASLEASAKGGTLTVRESF